MRLSKVDCIAVLFSLFTIASANAQQVVRIGYAPFTPPLACLPGATSINYRSIDSRGTMAEGAMLEVFRAIAKEAGFQTRFIPIVGADMIAAFNARTFDLGAFSFLTSKIADLTDPVYMNSEGFLVRKTDPKAYTSWDDLKGEVVAAQPNSEVADALRNSGIFKEIMFVADGQAGARAVENGTAKAYITTTMIGALGNVRETTGPFSNLHVPTTYIPRFRFLTSIAGQKDDPLVAKVNASLSKLKADGVLRTIFERYGIENVLIK